MLKSKNEEKMINYVLLFAITLVVIVITAITMGINKITMAKSSIYKTSLIHKWVRLILKPNCRYASMPGTWSSGC